jgi:hypothetical protein
VISTDTTSTVLALFIYEPTTLDGFRIIGASTTPHDVQYALFIESADSSLTIRNCEARAGDRGHGRHLRCGDHQRGGLRRE